MNVSSCGSRHDCLMRGANDCSEGRLSGLGVRVGDFCSMFFRDCLLDADETVTRPLTFQAGAIRTDNLRRELSPISVAAAFQTFDDAGAATNIFNIAGDFSIAICGTINRHLVHGSISPFDLSIADGLIHQG